MKIEQFRQARSEDLKIAAKVIENTFSGDINTSPITIAAELLKTHSPILKNGTTDADCWGYEITDLKIPVDTIKHIKPKEIINNKLELILNMKLIASFKDWERLNDPFIELNFNVIIRGISIKENDEESHYFCFHIDKHDMAENSEEPHPIYHLQYSNNPYKSTNFNYGSTLYIDTPRILHHPVDLILGIGFLTSNFFPSAFEAIMDDGFFPGLYKKYQDRIIKPYFHTLASHWDYNKSNVVWKPTKDLCPFLI